MTAKGSSGTQGGFPFSANQLWKNLTVLPDSNTTNDEPQKGPNVSLESVIRVMFASCTGTSGMNVSSSDSPSVSPSTPTKSQGKSQDTPQPTSPTQNEDSLYTKLFSDNQMRAEEAISHLRQQMDDRRPEKKRPVKEFPGVFPISSPLREDRQISVPAIHDSVAPGVQHRFDDEISLLSQETLDEIIMMYDGDTFINRVHSDVTQDPLTTVDESWKHTIRPRGEMMPDLFSREESFQGTVNTRQSKDTKTSKSSMSSKTSEFASVWRKDEERYWQCVVQEQEGSPSRCRVSRRNRERNRSKSTDRKSKHTLPTVNSSLYSITSAGEDDPDRMMTVLVMPPGTEMGEI